MKKYEFLEAIKKYDQITVPVIAEIKLRSGNGCDLLQSRSPENLARQYRKAGAQALSVVTGSWFGGNLDLLKRIVGCDTGLPVLRKDFICSRRTLDETREYGASAVLLTCKLLKSVQLNRLIEHALDVGLTPLVEVASKDELAELPEGYPIILASNNADIESREVVGPGISRSWGLFRTMAAKKPSALVSAGKIYDAQTAADLLSQGFDALLMGTALMRDSKMLNDIRSRLDLIRDVV